MVSEKALFKIFADNNGLSQNDMVMKVGTSLDVQLSDLAVAEVIKCFKRFEAKKKRWYTDKHAPIDFETLVSSGNENELIEDAATLIAPPKKFRKSIDNLNRTQETRRTDEIWTSVVSQAEKEGVDPAVILGLLLTRYKDLPLKAVGRRIVNGEAVNAEVKEIPLITALTIYCDCNLGKETYTKQKRLLSSVGCPIFPPWSRVRELQQSITPEVQNLPAPYKGVYFPFLKAVEKTTVRLLETGLEIQQAGSDLKMKLKYGFDGSGSHAIYNQKNNADTNNMILTVFCPLNMHEEEKLVWEEECPNIANTQRPLILQMGKEERETLEAQGLLNEDIHSMTTQGFLVGEQKRKVLVEGVHTMFDRKAADMYLGCTGAYCDLCIKSKKQCLQHIKKREAFNIDRNVDTMHQIFADLADEDGEITKHNNDYQTRQGQIHKPIPNHEVKSTQVLHGLLRSFDHFMKAVVHVKAGSNDWSEIPGSYNKMFCDNSKNALRSALKESLHVKWDQPDPAGKGGTTTTGNTKRSRYQRVGCCVEGKVL